MNGMKVKRKTYIGAGVVGKRIAELYRVTYFENLPSLFSVSVSYNVTCFDDLKREIADFRAANAGRFQRKVRIERFGLA